MIVIDLCVGVVFVIVVFLVDGEIEIYGVEYIECGYSKIIEKLFVIGVNIICSSVVEIKL